MNHDDHMDLIRRGITGAGKSWADLGSGSGAFTLALADLLGPEGEIYSVDRNPRALREQAESMRSLFPDTRLHQIQGDIGHRLNLPLLDGIIVANALHFIDRKEPVFKAIHDTLKPGGCLVIVEYNTDRGNHWVPYPFSFSTFAGLAEGTGLTGIRQLSSRPSRFLGQIYSAIAFRPM